MRVKNKGRFVNCENKLFPKLLLPVIKLEVSHVTSRLLHH